MNDQINALRERLEVLEAKNQSLCEWQNGANQLLSQMAELLEQQEKKQQEAESRLQALSRMASINRWRINSLPYELRDPDYISPVFKPHILSTEETRRQIIKEHKSLARLGDGEFAAIAGSWRWNFQNICPELGKKLRKVLQATEKDILIGLNPTFYRNLDDMEEEDADGVRAYMAPEVRKLHAALLDRDKIYADALFHNIYAEEDVNTLRRLWEGRDLVFIEGEYTRMGVGNDLFDNCRSITRILGPAENAFDRYDEILKAALKQPQSRLFLLALGPTATALAYDLFLAGYQAVDIGHIDLIYERYRAAAPNLYKVKIPYKYCSSDEIGERRQIEEIDDPIYEQQIAERIT